MSVAVGREGLCKLRSVTRAVHGEAVARTDTRNIAAKEKRWLTLDSEAR